MKGRVLIIAGSDSGGGAGIQADIKAVTALGGYAMTAVTALTAQNTLGVQGIHEAPPAFVKQQIESVLSDIGADAIKIGMLHNAEVIEAVHEAIADYVVNVPLVVDPVMVATSGASLLQERAVNALMQKIIPMADLLTPNIPEATALSGIEWGSDEDAGRLTQMLSSLGPKAILLKAAICPETGCAIYWFTRTTRLMCSKGRVLRPPIPMAPAAPSLQPSLAVWPRGWGCAMRSAGRENTSLRQFVRLQGMAKATARSTTATPFPSLIRGYSWQSSTNG